MIPGKQHILFNALVRTFTFLILKIGISLVLAIAFSISQILFIYTMEESILVVGILQILCFYGVYRSLGEYLFYDWWR